VHLLHAARDSHEDEPTLLFKLLGMVEVKRAMLKRDPLIPYLLVHNGEHVNLISCLFEPQLFNPN
jgi:hypothetical protein